MTRIGIALAGALLSAALPAHGKVVEHANSIDQHGNAVLYGPFPPVNDRDWKIQNLYSGYRTYVLVRSCYDARAGYAMVYVNDVEMDRARQKAKDLEDDAKAANEGLNVQPIWDKAAANVRGYAINAPACSEYLQTLYDVRSSHSPLKVEKDF